MYIYVYVVNMGGVDIYVPHCTNGGHHISSKNQTPSIRIEGKVLHTLNCFMDLNS